MSRNNLLYYIIGATLVDLLALSSTYGTLVVMYGQSSTVGTTWYHIPAAY